MYLGYEPLVTCEVYPNGAECKWLVGARLVGLFPLPSLITEFVRTSEAWVTQALWPGLPQ